MPRITASALVASIVPPTGALLLWLTVVPAAGAQAPGGAGGRPPGEGPTRVEVGFHLLDLVRISDVDETFLADVYLITSWTDPRLAGGPDRVVPAASVWTPDLVVLNQRDVRRGLPEEVGIDPGGVVVQRQRLTGTFASRLDLHRYPMDAQTLRIQLVMHGAGADDVVLAESPRFPPTRSPEPAIRDWAVGALRSETGTLRPTPNALELSTFSVLVEVDRLTGYYTVQLLIPLLLIVGMSSVVFWVDPTVVPTRVHGAITTVLTLIAFRFMLGGLVPRLPYLTFMDYLLLGATVLVAAALAAVTLGAYLVKDRAAAVRRMDRVARVAYPLGFVGFVLVLRWWVW